MPAIWCHHIVPRLRSAVESDDGANITDSGQVIDDRSFAAIAVTETDNDGCPG